MVHGEARDVKEIGSRKGGTRISRIRGSAADLLEEKGMAELFRGTKKKQFNFGFTIWEGRAPAPSGFTISDGKSSIEERCAEGEAGISIESPFPLLYRTNVLESRTRIVHRRPQTSTVYCLFNLVF
jgi:hypothetical protein